MRRHTILGLSTVLLASAASIAPANAGFVSPEGLLPPDYAMLFE